MDHNELMKAVFTAYETSTHPDKLDLLLMAKDDYKDFKRMVMGREDLFDSSARTLRVVLRSLTAVKG